MKGFKSSLDKDTIYLMNIGYWNINKKDFDQIGEYIIDLIYDKKLDLLLLSEFENVNSLIFEKHLPNDYQIVKGGDICTKVMAIKRKSSDLVVCTESLRHLLLKSSNKDIVIVGLHLSDRRNYPKPDKRREEINDILESVKTTKSSNVVFVGDFNCMPYDEELTYSFGMHAVLFKKEMQREQEGKEKHYNPMLLLLNEKDELYGTYRYLDAIHPIYWYTFDQVIVSKNLMNSISNIDFLKNIKGKSLMSNKDTTPYISDHLPLVFEMGEK